MNPGIVLHACPCGQVCFPARRICHRCGQSAWTELPTHEGTVDQVTSVNGTHLASIGTPPGVVLIARLQDPAPPGTPVTLTTSAGAIVAQARPPSPSQARLP